MKVLALLILYFSSLDTYPQSDNIYKVIDSSISSTLTLEDLQDVKLDTLVYENMFDCFPCAPSTPLQNAVFGKKYDLMTLLIKAGADVNYPDLGANTPLHFAANSNDTIAARILLHHLAGIEIKNHENLTPFLVAAMWSNPEMVMFMIEAGADTDVRDSYHRNAIQISEECCGDGYGEIIDNESRTHTKAILLQTMRK